MKPLKNAALALMAVSFMAACSSTRSAGSSSGTTGMSSGSSSDMTTTTTTTTTSYDASVPGSYGASYAGTVDMGPYSETAYGSGNRSRWSGMGTSYDPAAERTHFQAFMNGYQGPLDYVSFDASTDAKSFLTLAAENDARELALSKIAQSKGSSAEVRAFADMMVNDHAKSSQELMSVAYASGVTLPTYNFYATGGMTPSTSMGTSSTTTMSTSGSSSMNNNNNMGTTSGVSSSYNGNQSLVGDPKIAPPLANDLRDISGFPPEQANVNASNSTTATSGSVAATKGDGQAMAPYTDSKIAAPLANDLRDISGFPPGTETKTAGSATTAPMNSGTGSTTNWSTTGSSSTSTTSGSTWGSNNSASAMATMNEITALNNLEGAAFDAQYSRMMVQDHYQAIQLFKSAANSSDAKVKAYAEKTLPVLMAHYDQARRLK